MVEVAPLTVEDVAEAELTHVLAHEVGVPGRAERVDGVLVVVGVEVPEDHPVVVADAGRVGLDPVGELVCGQGASAVAAAGPLVVVAGPALSSRS